MGKANYARDKAIHSTVIFYCYNTQLCLALVVEFLDYCDKEDFKTENN
jgi:hypothetical protein